MPAASETIERSCPSRRAASRGLRAPPMRPRVRIVLPEGLGAVPDGRERPARQPAPICRCSSGRPRIRAARGLVPASHRLVPLRPPAPRAARGLLPPIHRGVPLRPPAPRAARGLVPASLHGVPLRPPAPRAARGLVRASLCGAAGDVGARRAATRQLRRPLAWCVGARGSRSGAGEGGSRVPLVAAGDESERWVATRQLRRPLAWPLATSARGGRRLGSFGGLSRGASGPGDRGAGTVGAGAARLSFYDGSAGGRAPGARPPPPLTPSRPLQAAGDESERRAATRQLRRPLAWPLAKSASGGRRLGSFGGLSRGRWRRERAAGGDSAASAASRVVRRGPGIAERGRPLATSARGGRRLGSFGGLSRSASGPGDRGAGPAAGDESERRAATRQLRRPLAWFVGARGSRSGAGAPSQPPLTPLRPLQAAGDESERLAATWQLRRPLAWPLATSARGGRRLGSFGGLSRGARPPPPLTQPLACPRQAAADVGARRAATRQLRRPLAWPLATRASGWRRLGSFGGLSRSRWRRRRAAGGDSAASAASRVVRRGPGIAERGRPLATRASGGRRLGSFGGLSRGRWRRERAAGGYLAASAASRVAAGDVGARRAATRQLRRPLAWSAPAAPLTQPLACPRQAAGDVGARRAATRQLRRPLACRPLPTSARGGRRLGSFGGLSRGASGPGDCGAGPVRAGAARLSLYDGSAGGRAPGARPPPPLTPPRPLQAAGDESERLAATRQLRRPVPFVIYLLVVAAPYTHIPPPPPGPDASLLS
eukprot:tig00020616_g12285.t1